MSTGLFRIVDAVNAIGAAALNTAADLGVAVSAAQAAGTALDHRHAGAGDQRGVQSADAHLADHVLFVALRDRKSVV